MQQQAEEGQGREEEREGCKQVFVKALTHALGPSSPPALRLTAVCLTATGQQVGGGLEAMRACRA